MMSTITEEDILGRNPYRDADEIAESDDYSNRLEVDQHRCRDSVSVDPHSLLLGALAPH